MDPSEVPVRMLVKVDSMSCKAWYCLSLLMALKWWSGRSDENISYLYFVCWICVYVWPLECNRIHNHKESTLDGSIIDAAGSSFKSMCKSTRSSHTKQSDSATTKTCEGEPSCKRLGMPSVCSDCGTRHLWRLMDPGWISGWHSNAFIPFKTTIDCSERRNLFVVELKHGKWIGKHGWYYRGHWINRPLDLKFDFILPIYSCCVSIAWKSSNEMNSQLLSAWPFLHNLIPFLCNSIKL